MKRLLLCSALALSLITGCRRGLDPNADQADAEKALRAALEAWKGGKSQDDLANDVPPIIMNEDDWRTGKRLLEYKMAEGALSGRQIRCRVKLKLQEKENKTTDRDAVYIIDTIPRIVI